MKPLNRNISILEHIVSYCGQIEETVQRFGDSLEVFRQDQIYRNAAALCILQIGELVGNLSEEFRAQHPGIPWRQIKAMRNIVAHRYGTVDPETAWEIIQEDIPILSEYCRKIIVDVKLQQSEEDIKTGHVHTQEALDQHMEEFLK